MVILGRCGFPYCWEVSTIGRLFLGEALGVVLGFSFGGFRDFQSTRRFSFRPVSGGGRLKPIQITTICNTGTSNGSGFLGTLCFISCFVHANCTTNSTGSRVPVTPFLLSSRSQSDSARFSVSFVTDGLGCRFSFNIGGGRIACRGLAICQSGRPSLLCSHSSVGKRRSVGFNDAFANTGGRL